MDQTPIVDKFSDLRKVQDRSVLFVDGRGASHRYTHKELLDTAQSFAGGLLKSGVNPGEPVVLVMTNPEAAVITILGCMMLGCPPTPVYPPQNLQAVPGFLSFVKHVADRSNATLIISEGQPHIFLGAIPHETKTIRGVQKFETIFAGNTGGDLPKSISNPAAFLQFTSGSTSTPKGVVVSHQGLAANLWMIREASQMDTKSCVVTWLPVYHDMGLIGTVLNAITMPCNLVVLPPLAFPKRPGLWLELISEHRGTHTAAPNFAYGICARKIQDTGNLDLSTMTTFICGAEPVIPATMDDFVERFRSAGLRPGAMVPAYGLAEATLAVTFTPYLRGMAEDTVDRNALSARGVATVLDGTNSHSVRIASCGVPMAGLSVRVASESGTAVLERQVGEVQILGPSVTPGYIGDDDATRTSRTPDGWLKTGDLGYFSGSELHICGRIKDVIIVRGKNFHAHDLEIVASDVPGIRTGNVVAFGATHRQSEVLIIVAESRLEDDPQLVRKVRNHLTETIGVSPDEVIVVPPGTLPKTSSGKLKRLETKSLYETGRLFRKKSKTAGYIEALKSRLGFLRKRK